MQQHTDTLALKVRFYSSSGSHGFFIQVGFSMTTSNQISTAIFRSVNVDEMKYEIERTLKNLTCRAYCNTRRSKSISSELTTLLRSSHNNIMEELCKDIDELFNDNEKSNSIRLSLPCNEAGIQITIEKLRAVSKLV